MRRSRYRTKLANSEFASCKQTFPFSTLNNNQAYVDYEVSLARSIRASQIGQGYKEFRISKVEYLFKPLVDTFIPSAPGLGAGIPYLYAMVDKAGTLTDFNSADQLREAGAKPRRFDDKTLRVAFKPAVLNYAYDKNNLGNAWSKPTVSPWLSTAKFADATQPWTASSIDHLGLAWIVDGGGSSGYQLEITIHYQFRKPNYITQTTTLEGSPVKAIQVGGEKDTTGPTGAAPV